MSARPQHSPALALAKGRPCCDVPDEQAPAGSPVIALAGAPNSGKSSLFNGLTGLRATTGNWPGTSVECAHGVWKLGERTLELVDLPGAYSLDPTSPDEALTRDLLATPEAEGRPELAVVVVDAAHLVRSLYLTSQLRESPVRLVVALSMVDVARARGVEIDTDALAAALGCPVVAVDPRRRRGLDVLARAVTASLNGPAPTPRPHADATADDLEREDDRFAFIEAAVGSATRSTGATVVNWSDRIDRVATHPLGGPLLFLAVMFLVFQATTTVAAPLQDALDTLFNGPVRDALAGGLASVGLSGTWVEGLLLDGLLAGVGMLMTFVPLMTIMFVLLALLEDSGYMARAALVTDRLMRLIGLPGKAFLPLVVGFGCNVPAISATRILANRRQRVLTALLVPFTSCSARLSVYMLLANAFFGAQAGTVVFLLYLGSIVFVVLVGLLLRHTLWRTMGDEVLVLDLPPYQRPTVRIIAAVAWERLKGFLQTAAGIIVVAVCLVWLVQAVPAPGASGAFGQVAVADSWYAHVAQAIAPVFAPAGFGAWQLAAALVIGFVAKETVLTSLAQTFAASDADPAHLSQHLVDTFAASSGGHPQAAAAAFLVFVLAYTPCVATIAAQRREIGGRWTAFGLLVNLVSAYAAAVLVFQLGRLL